jgi:hypothetical protein
VLSRLYYMQCISCIEMTLCAQSTSNVVDVDDRGATDMDSHQDTFVGQFDTSKDTPCMRTLPIYVHACLYVCAGPLICGCTPPYVCAHSESPACMFAHACYMRARLPICAHACLYTCARLPICVRTPACMCAHACHMRAWARPFCPPSTRKYKW